MHRVRSLAVLCTLLLGLGALSACSDVTAPIAAHESMASTEGQGFGNTEGQGFGNVGVDTARTAATATAAGDAGDDGDADDDGEGQGFGN